MAITIRSTFLVDARPDEAWASLTDIEQSAPCFPGAELKERQDDGGYKGGFTVKLGPLTFKFNGKFKITEQDDANRTFVVIASGTDTKGRGGADARIHVAVLDEGGKSRVNVVSDVNLSGTVAQYGRGVGMIEALSKQLLEQFGKNLAAQILSQSEPYVEPVAAPPLVEPVAAANMATPPAPSTTATPASPALAATIQPRRPAAPVAALDAGALMRQAVWQSVVNFFARRFGRGQTR